MASGPLAELAPDVPSADELLDAFLSWTADIGLDLYPHQEEAILELFAGNHVVLATPTGSGKSMVAMAAHFAAFSRGEKSWYTAPIKALVSEKFFDLCRAFGSDHVGMLTGDVAVNPGAPVLCCTAEVLANSALRSGSGTDAATVISDEFHYYGDPSRGWAWQVPLLELTDTQFLLMSATLGDTSFLVDDLTTRTGRPTALVDDAQRPVPLDGEYRTSTIHETLTELIEGDRTPVYVVHFTQRQATERAQDLMSMTVLSKEQKAAAAEAIGGFRFDAGFGRDLSRWVRSGIGVHHAGMLPKYRLLVEKLAQGGHLKVICGTDTLGVGVNLPIRTVLFTQLCKYDGQSVRALGVREFQQIAGRAGRAGLDDRGHVWVQAPEHVVENLRIDAKVAADPSRKKKLQKKKPPEKGYAHWDESTFERLFGGTPETLSSSFDVSHSMMLHLLDRPGDGCRAARRLLLDNHEPRGRTRRHIRRAIGIYRSLREAGVVEQLDEPDEQGRRVRVTLDLQDDFALNQPLSLFVLDMVDLLDPDDDAYALDVVSVIEAISDNPMVVLYAQLDRARTELLAELKAAGVEYEERMERLDALTWPQPLADELYTTFNLWRRHHPWVGGDTVKPKSVVRELYERAMTFGEYVGFHGLKRSEGVLLRYLTDVYKAMRQTVPEAARTDELDDLVEWLGETIRAVDSSLIDEWERLRNPDPDVAPSAVAIGAEHDVTRNTRAFAVMVRNATFRWVQLLARRDHARLAGEATRPDGRGWTVEELDEAMAPYWAEHSELDDGPAARGPALHQLDGDRVSQTLLDPAGYGEWVLIGQVDRPASIEAGAAVVRLEDITRL